MIEREKEETDLEFWVPKHRNEETEVVFKHDEKKSLMAI
jgi:hypothetical protein